MMTSSTIDVVIASYRERIEALRATVGACLAQTAEIGALWVVDDGSPTPITRDTLPAEQRLRLVRMNHNLGISAARMAAISQATADHVACVNVDILPAPDWGQVCQQYLSTHERVGVVYTRLQPANPGRLLSQWRMRFHEEKYDREEGAATFAPGHAVLFRRDAINAVGGYDLALRRIGEDSEICERLWRAGWEVHFTNRSYCISIQTDTLRYLARKQLLRDGLDPAAARVRPVLSRALRGLTNRLGRNLLRGRFTFVPVDLGVFALEVVYLARARVRW